MIGPLELVVILFIIFVLLGPKRITGLFKALGRSAKDFTDEFGRKDPEQKSLPDEKETTDDERREEPPRDRP